MDTSENSSQIRELTSQLDELSIRYDDLFNRFGQKLSTSQIDNLNRAFEITNGKIDALNAKMADSVYRELNSEMAKFVKLQKEISQKKIEIQTIKSQDGDLEYISTLERQLKDLENTYICEEALSHFYKISASKEAKQEAISSMERIRASNFLIWATPFTII